MAPIQLVIAPDPILNLRSHPVKQEEMTDEMRIFIKDMTNAIYSDNAAGFAAVQFGVHKRIIVIDLQNDDEAERPKGFYPLIIINPEFTFMSEDMVTAKEGCMSIPEIRLEVPRPREVEIKYVDMDFKEHILRTEGWLARALQHEFDHLEGKTLLDHMSGLKRDVSMRKLEKIKRRAL